MSLHIDTHALIWFLNRDKQISDNANAAIENPDNFKIVSIASV
jgi:PIN domain nuclease of toxin-antitoxin system